MDLSIDMDNSDLAVTVSTQFFWVDNRVIKLKKGVSKLNLEPNILNELWIPDFYIYDLQSFHNFKLFRDVQQGLRIEEKENLDSGSLINCTLGKPSNVKRVSIFWLRQELNELQTEPKLIRHLKASLSW